MIRGSCHVNILLLFYSFETSYLRSSGERCCSEYFSTLTGSQKGLGFTGSAHDKPETIPPPLFPPKCHIITAASVLHNGSLVLAGCCSVSRLSLHLHRLHGGPPTLSLVIDLAVLRKCSRWLQSSLRSSLWLLCCLYLAAIYSKLAPSRSSICAHNRCAGIPRSIPR